MLNETPLLDAMIVEDAQTELERLEARARVLRKRIAVLSREPQRPPYFVKFWI